MKKFSTIKKSGFFLGLMLLTSTLSVLAAEDHYTAKARHLYQFAKYVQWPKTKTLNLCIIKPDPFGQKRLKRFFHKPKISGRRLQIKRLPPTAAVNACHLIFFNKQLNHSQIKTILSQTQPYALTVGEQPGFIQLGGIINFIMHQQHVLYELNRSQAQKQGLVMNYRLVRHARKRY